MEGVSNNAAAVRPPYKSTKKGAVIGAGVGAASSAVALGLGACSMMPLKGKTSIAEKKNFIKMASDQFSKTGIDLKKTTVSKCYKEGMKKLKSPLTFAKNMAIFAAIGAGIGFVNDMIKNKKAANAQAEAQKA